MNLKEALASLDPSNDEHWTKEGLPILAVLANLIGTDVSRADVTAIAPAFNRQNPVVEVATARTPWGAGQEQVEVPLETAPVVSTEEDPVAVAQEAFNAAEEAVRAAVKVREQAQQDLIAAEQARNESSTFSHAQVVKMYQQSALQEQQSEADKLAKLKQLLNNPNLL